MPEKEQTMICLICGKKVKSEDDPFEQFTVANTTICKECKVRLESK